MARRGLAWPGAAWQGLAGQGSLIGSDDRTQARTSHMMPSIQMLGIDLDALKGAVVVWAGDMDPSPFGNHGKGELIAGY